jgi:hypothetical protein
MGSRRGQHRVLELGVLTAAEGALRQEPLAIAEVSHSA